MQHTIEIDGHCHVYTSVGNSEKPAVVMIHGWNSYRGMWDGTIETLQHDYYCLALDLLGFGDSEKPRQADFSIEAQAKRVLTFIEVLGLDQFILIGHSMGGQIGLYIASELASDRVISLINIAGVVTGKTRWQVNLFMPIIHLAYYLPFMVTIAHQCIHSPFIAKLAFRSLFYDVNSIPYADWEEDRRVSVQKWSHIASSRALRALKRENLDDKLSNISAPTLIIFGLQDGLVPFSEAEIAYSNILDSQLIIYDKCGHFPVYERKSDYLDAIHQFLQQPNAPIPQIH